MANQLEKEFQYYKDHQKELVEKYDGKVIVIKNCKVIGTYDSDEQAFVEISKTHKVGTFLIQKCEAGKQAYTEIFHSRVSFV